MIVSGEMEVNEVQNGKRRRRTRRISVGRPFAITTRSNGACKQDESSRPMPEEDPEPNWWKEGAKEGGHKNKVRISALLCEHDKGDE